MRTFFLLFLATISIISCAEKQEKPDDDTALLAEAQRIHENVMTLDTHCDINVANFTDSINYTQRLVSQVNLPKMVEGGLDVPWFIVYTGQGDLTPEGYEAAHKNAISKFDAIHKLCEEIAPEQIALATNSEQARNIWKSGKKVAMIGIENGYPVGTDITNVEKFYNLGARYMSLAHNGHSQLSDSNTGEEDNVWLHNGVSDLGKEVISEMNRLGMMIDVSHPSKEAMRQMIDLSKAPIIASHSSARALCNHSRNLDDEQLQWLKENGGVVQTVAFKSYLNTEKNDARAAAETEVFKKMADSLGFKYYTRQEARDLPKDDRDAYYANYMKSLPLMKEKLAAMTDLPAAVDVGDFVNHIDYLVGKIGIDHVGISSDFDGGGGVDGWSDASETFNVTLELTKRGYTEAQIAQLWSGNLLRVLDEVEAVAKNIQQS